MKRLLVVLLCIVLLAGLAAAVVPGPSLPKVYSVATVQAGRQQDPVAWSGRDVLVRGWFGGFGLGYSTGPRPTQERIVRWNLIQSMPDVGPALPDFATPLAFCKNATRGRRVLVIAFASGVHRPLPTVGYAPGGSPFLQFLSHVPVIGLLVPSSAVYQGTIFHVRLLTPHRCTIVRQIGFAMPYPDAVLLDNVR